MRFGDEIFIPRLPTSRGLYTTDICGLVGRAGLEPAYPEGGGFMVLETRIELEIYEFENLDYFLLALCVK